ncbi:hypothetical protein M2175_009015 [Bradyrhizobium elkanii]|uniref:HamA C-terminal domain-containing protein n=1 Tax=Bradyrhizobium TaxID=374 RepID=UPI0021673E4D|nr:MULTISPECIES: dsDNA nuclease domain-containing protein [Bradyrhizobium]MCS3933984.1 hypothetical protein [Bradyrhizobium elkanii]MCS3974541.1 hypothetical protein [Bradyrhizobium japonicum]
MDDISDAGGVAARIGFKYQDHVAASFVLEMIGDPRVTQIECETSDDITRMLQLGGRRFPEYVQVKTTERDKNWTATEIAKRSSETSPSSLIEKSLLADKHQPDARFRIVTRRSVNAALRALLDPVDKRDPNGEIAHLATKLKAKHPKTISSGGHDLAYWTMNALWDPRSGLEYLESHNLQFLSRIAEEMGANPSHSQSRQIYRELLYMVDDAATASRRDKSKKIITRAAIRAWWDTKLAALHANATATMKPYRIRGTRFFVEVHNFQHKGPRRSLGYDAQYERNAWRSAELSKHLVTWIAELTLRPSELVEIDQLNLKRKLEAGLRAISAQRSLHINHILGEALLHAVLRHFFGSEPVACKLFHRSPLGDRITKNAHIVHSPQGDQLWLGKTYLFSTGDQDALLAQISQDLCELIDTDVLKEERQVIIQLREPQHFLANTLFEAFSQGSPIDRLIEVLCVPVLIAYDSAVLQAGYSNDYVERLQEEIGLFSKACVASLPKQISEVQVHVIFVPIEKLSVLSKQFESEVGLR